MPTDRKNPRRSTYGKPQSAQPYERSKGKPARQTERSARDTRYASRDTRDGQDTRYTRDSRDTRDNRGTRGTRDTRTTRDARPMAQPARSTRPSMPPERTMPPQRRGAPPPPPLRPAPAFEGEEALPRENILLGRNPIREALKSGRDMEKLLVARGDLSGSARVIVSMARDMHIIVQVVDRERLSEIAPNHQGMIAIVSAFRYSTVEDMLALAKEREEDPLLVILDGITDPHNLGAIIRSAECAGAHGVIVPERRAVGLTPAAVKSSAGAVEYVPVARVGNLTRFIESLKAQGIWVTSADMSGESYTSADLTGPMALVVGAEGSGVSRLVLESSDRRVALPMAGKIQSLNASVATGVMLYEVRRQRTAAK